jgi:ABC-type transporter Mla maintaining outer membrane lipid asymmetry ATPase subunit MlaF
MAASEQTLHARGQPAILAEGLGKRFGEVRALDGVDLELPAGKVLALLGPTRTRDLRRDRPVMALAG